jgi:hypothetical protein
VLSRVFKCPLTYPIAAGSNNNRVCLYVDGAPGPNCDSYADESTLLRAELSSAPAEVTSYRSLPCEVTTKALSPQDSTPIMRAAEKMARERIAVGLCVLIAEALVGNLGARPWLVNRLPPRASQGHPLSYISSSVIRSLLQRRA